jgi:DNA-binding GntR family transcriptional regulator
MSGPSDGTIESRGTAGLRWRRFDYLNERSDLNGFRLVKPRKADAAYCKLKDLILTSELTPGEMLDERELMERLDTGRTPLREAIQRLAHDRLVSIAPRKGSWVSELSIADLQELTAARELVEPPVAASATAHITAADIASLRLLVERAANALQAGDLLAAIQGDRAFHHSLAMIGGNSYLARVVDDINTATLRYWHLSFRHVHDISPAHNHHFRILDCLEEGDPAAVEAVMREHIDVFRRRMQEVLGNGV